MVGQAAGEAQAFLSNKGVVVVETVEKPEASQVQPLALTAPLIVQVAGVAVPMVKQMPRGQWVDAVAMESSGLHHGSPGGHSGRHISHLARFSRPAYF